MLLDLKRPCAFCGGKRRHLPRCARALVERRKRTRGIRQRTDAAVDMDARQRRRPLPVPTSALPGTPEKVVALTGRQERGENLWNPLDATWEARPVDADDSRLGILDAPADKNGGSHRSALDNPEYDAARTIGRQVRLAAELAANCEAALKARAREEAAKVG